MKRNTIMDKNLCLSPSHSPRKKRDSKFTDMEKNTKFG